MCFSKNKKTFLNSILIASLFNCQICTIYCQIRGKDGILIRIYCANTMQNVQIHRILACIPKSFNKFNKYHLQGASGFMLFISNDILSKFFCQYFCYLFLTFMVIFFVYLL